MNLVIKRFLQKMRIRGGMLKIITPGLLNIYKAKIRSIRITKTGEVVLRITEGIRIEHAYRPGEITRQWTDRILKFTPAGTVLYNDDRIEFPYGESVLVVMKHPPKEPV